MTGSRTAPADIGRCRLYRLDSAVMMRSSFRP